MSDLPESNVAATDPATLVAAEVPEVTELLAAASAAAGAELRRATLRNLHHRGRRSVSCVYEATLRVEGDDREVLLVTHVDRKGYPEGAFVLGRGREQVAVWRFPFDPYLPGLPSAIDPQRVRELLDELGALPGAVRLYTRAYRPSRRAVVEVRIEGEAVAGRILYLKVLAGDRASELGGYHRALRPHVPVPRVVGVAPRQGILALEALGGRTLRQALVEGAPLPDPAQLVELSERFARSGLVTRRDPRRFADPTRHVEGLAHLVPDRADDLRRVAAEAATVTGPLVPVHGDLHDGQLLLDDDGTVTGLLDVDGSGSGLIAEDAGNLVAHVEVIAELWPDLADRVASYAVAIADAFRPLIGADALARATAGSWIGLATGPHRAQDVDWPERTRARIDRAVAALEAR